MTQRNLAIIIINYKTAEMTIECVKSVIPEIINTPSKIILVDNFSNDGSITKIQSWIEINQYENIVKLILSPVNSGFSGGNNQGIKSIDAEFYMLLNSDTLVRPGAIKKMLSIFEAHNNTGIVSPRLEDLDGKGQISCFNFHTPTSEFIDIANTGIITRLLKKHNVPIEMIDNISRPQWTSFACVVLNQKMINDIGLMDENYFLYYEDSDYCKQASKKGWGIINTPDARVVHLRGGSAELKKKKKQRQRLPTYYFESREYYFRKNFGFSGFLLANFLWSFGRIISKTRELIENKPKAASNKQWQDIWYRANETRKIS